MFSLRVTFFYIASYFCNKSSSLGFMESTGRNILIKKGKYINIGTLQTHYTDFFWKGCLLKFPRLLSVVCPLCQWEAEGGSERVGRCVCVWRPSLALSSAAVTRRRQEHLITLSPSSPLIHISIWQLPGRPWRLEGKLKATLKLQERGLMVTVTVWMNWARHTAQWVGLGLYSRLLILSGPYCRLCVRFDQRFWYLGVVLVFFFNFRLFQ